MVTRKKPGETLLTPNKISNLKKLSAKKTARMVPTARVVYTVVSCGRHMRASERGILPGGCGLQFSDGSMFPECDPGAENMS